VIKEFIPVANEAKRTLDENSDCTWIITHWRLDPNEDAQKLLDSINAGKSRLRRVRSSCFDEIFRRISLRCKGIFVCVCEGG
jgi:hypothetical protein